MDDAAAIQITGLTKGYGEGRGLFDLDLDVRRGEILGFLGPNAQASRQRCGSCST